MNQIHNEDASAEQALLRLIEVALMVGEYVEHNLAGRGLTRARAGLVWRLRQDGPVTQRALSEALRVTPRNVTGLVDALVADGLVARTPHPSDRRATLVTLTDQGKEVAEALADDYRSGGDYLFGGVPEAELTGFVRTAEQVMARVRAASHPLC